MASWAGGGAEAIKAIAASGQRILLATRQLLDGEGATENVAAQLVQWLLTSQQTQGHPSPRRLPSLPKSNERRRPHQPLLVAKALPTHTMTPVILPTPSSRAKALAAITPRVRRKASGITAFCIVEDDFQTATRQTARGVKGASTTVTVRLHKVEHGQYAGAYATTSYQTGELYSRGSQSSRAAIALQMLEGARTDKGVVVAGPQYGGSATFLRVLREKGADLVVEVRKASSVVSRIRTGMKSVHPLLRVLDRARWAVYWIDNPEAGSATAFSAAELGVIEDRSMRVVAYTPGSVVDTAADLRIVVTTFMTTPLDQIISCVGWARWVRTLTRRAAKSELLKDLEPRIQDEPPASLKYIDIVGRPNIRLSRQQDMLLLHQPNGYRASETSSESTGALLNVVELFAGAGGLGLGFLLAGDAQRKFKLLYSAEVEPIYVSTLRRNHSFFRRHLSEMPDQTPVDAAPTDLRERRSVDFMLEAARAAGGADVLIGGPPCQGFSTANRNSLYPDNPNNLLIEVFLHCVRRLKPRIAVLENVQGILWTERREGGSRLCVADHAARSLSRAGYTTYARLLDAVWYGVPQHRARFFLIALHRDLGINPDDLGEWGPFPIPTNGPTLSNGYTTVRQAISDLPRVQNGSAEDWLRYDEPSAATLSKNPFLVQMRQGAPRGVVTDHVTSRHSEYVLDRYRRLRPGQNWEDIADSLTNYTTVERTHSNIYRRLRETEPSITIGHYRKSMIVHPRQCRGLSLREAARLQSFPDWFRFSGTEDDRPGGLMHKQQQLANAVCPLLSKAVADRLLQLV